MMPYCGEYKDIVKMIREAAQNHWNSTSSEDMKVAILENATKIYIAQMQLMASGQQPQTDLKAETRGALNGAILTYEEPLRR